MTPWLEANGWEYVDHNRKDRTLHYFRSPGGIIAESFAIRVAIPNDDAILRAADAMIRFAQRAPGPTDPSGFDGRIGHYLTRFLMGRYFDLVHAPYMPSGWKPWGVMSRPAWMLACQSSGPPGSIGMMAWIGRRRGIARNTSALWFRACHHVANC
jgi:hypothetical protein